VVAASTCGRAEAPATAGAAGAGTSAGAASGAAAAAAGTDGGPRAAVAELETAEVVAKAGDCLRERFTTLTTTVGLR